MLFKSHDTSSPLNSTHYAKLYPQNGDRVVAIDSVTSLHRMYFRTPVQWMADVRCWQSVDGDQSQVLRAAV